jgi:hypothetical protein
MQFTVVADEGVSSIVTHHLTTQLTVVQCVQTSSTYSRIPVLPLHNSTKRKNVVG